MRESERERERERITKREIAEEVLASSYQITSDDQPRFFANTLSSTRVANSILHIN